MGGQEEEPPGGDWSPSKPVGETPPPCRLLEVYAQHGALQEAVLVVGPLLGLLCPTPTEDEGDHSAGCPSTDKDILHPPVCGIGAALPPCDLSVRLCVFIFAEVQCVFSLCGFVCEWGLLTTRCGRFHDMEFGFDSNCEMCLTACMYECALCMCRRGRLPIGCATKTGEMGLGGIDMRNFYVTSAFFAFSAIL